MEIANYIKPIKKSDFVISAPQSLFGEDWSLKEKGYCPVCYRKLYKMMSGNLLCKSKLHKGQKVFKSLSTGAISTKGATVLG